MFIPGDSRWIPPLQLADDTTLRFSPNHDDIINYDLGPHYAAVNVMPDTGPQTKNVWLFNVRDGPTEHHDLSEQNPQQVKLHRRYKNATSK